MSIFSRIKDWFTGYYNEEPDDTDTMSSTPSMITPKRVKSMTFTVGEGLDDKTKLAPGPTKELASLSTEERKKVEFVPVSKEGERVTPQLSQKVVARKQIETQVQRAREEQTLGQSVKDIAKTSSKELFSFAKKKTKEEFDKPAFQIWKDGVVLPYTIGKEVVKLLPQIPGFAFREGVSLSLDLTDKDKQITVPENLQFAIGEDPIKSFQQRYAESFGILKGLGATDIQSRNLAVLGVGLVTWTDLSAGGGKKKAEKELAKIIEKTLGEKVGVEFVEAEAKRISKLPKNIRQAEVNKVISSVIDDGSDAFKVSKEARYITDMETAGKEVIDETKTAVQEVKKSGVDLNLEQEVKNFKTKQITEQVKPTIETGITKSKADKFVNKDPYKIVQRIEEEGIDINFDKPQGLYTTPSNIESPHLDLGGKKRKFFIKKDAKVLTVNSDLGKDGIRGLGGKSAGMRAIDSLASKELKKELSMIKTISEAKEILFRDFPELKDNKKLLFHDTQDVLEAYAGKLAKKRGYDVINNLTSKTDKLSKQFEEVVILNKKVIETNPKIKKLLDEGTTSTVGEGKRIGSIGLDKFDVPKETKDNIIKVFKNSGIEGKAPQTEKQWLEAAKESDVLKNVIKPDEVVDANAKLLKTEQRIADIGKKLSKAKDPAERGKLLRESIELTRALNSELSARGRMLRAAGTKVDDESIINTLIKKMTKYTDDVDDMVKAGENVDFSDEKQVIDFYRKFVKPTWSDILTEYRYNNMLSSPRTIARNMFSNVVQTIVTRPAVKLTEATIDAFIKPLTGKQRETFFKDVPKYYYGLLKSIPDAFGEFKAVMKGERVLGQQDLKEALGQIPSGKLPGFMTIPSKTLEATDRLLQNLIAGGEMSAGKSAKEAAKIAEHSLFRAGLDIKNKTGQGRLLSGIDNVTSKIDGLRKVPGGTWFIPFLRTPMNFAKMWVEYSPAGLLTLPGASRKKEQIAKMLIGSTITAVGAKMAWDGDTTWSTPKDPEAKDLFYASGKKPYSVKIGDSWVPMIYLGPWAFALALPAAIKYNNEDSPESLTDSNMKKLSKNLSSMAQFYSQQTFMEGVGKFVELLSGDPDASLEKNLAFTSGQVIPLQGLIRYVSTITDPIYRKSNGFLEAIESGLPYFSKDLEPHTTPTGEPSKRNIYSYLAPYDITKEKEEYGKMLKLRNQELQSNNIRNEMDKETKKKALKIVETLQTETDDDKIMESIKELKGDTGLKSAVKSIYRKQAQYTAGSVQPYLILEPTDRAELMHTKMMLMQEGGKEEEEEFIENLEDMKEAGLWGAKERAAFKKLLKKYPLEDLNNNSKE